MSDEMDNLDDDMGDDHIIKLDSTLKNQLDRAFNGDFSNVRIHTGKYANNLTRNAAADALTIGSDIYFSDGKYFPDTEEGVKLLAHELQHIVQFQKQNRMVYVEDIAKLEHEASHVENQMGSLQLHNVSAPLLSQDNLPSGASHEPLQNNAEGLKKSSGQSGESGELTMRRGKPLVEILLSSGEKVMVDLPQYNAIKESVIRFCTETIDEQKHLLSDEDFISYMLKFSRFLKE